MLTIWLPVFNLSFISKVVERAATSHAMQRVSRPGFNYHMGECICEHSLCMTVATCQTLETLHAVESCVRESRACGGRVKSRILLSFNFNSVNTFLKTTKT